MTDKLDGFLREGLSRYPEAYSTVQLFQQTLENEIKKVIESKDDWAAFRLSDDDNAVKTFSGGRAGEGMWICALVTGTLPTNQDARIETGYWWRPPKLSLPVIAYANFYEKPLPLLRFKGTTQEARVRFADLMRYTRVFIEPSREFEVKADLDLVLGQLEAHAKQPSSAS